MFETRPSTQSISPAYVPPCGAASLAALAVFALYALTLAPTTQFWDTSEYIATAHILGIPHPPGNPLFVVLARAWEVLLAPTGWSVATRINLFSAAMSALAHGFWFLVADRLLYLVDARRGFRLAGAAAAVALSATAFTVWNQSNVNEKVYTVSLLTIALLSWLAMRWRDRLGKGGEGKLLLLMAFVLALSVGNHLMAFLAAPALLAFVLLVHPRALADWKLYAGLVAVSLIGLSIHFYLPLRAGLGPVINEGDPSSLRALLESLARRQYNKPSMWSNPLAPGMPRDPAILATQFLNYLQYFDWQWARRVSGAASWFGGLRPFFTLGMVGLGLSGAAVHWRRDRAGFAYFALLFATLSVGLVFYMNFLYGFSAPVAAPALDGFREVRERDYFFIASFSVWGIWAGIGVAAAWRALAVRLGGSRPLLVTAPVLAVALMPLALNWSWASRADDYIARDWAYNVLQSVEPYGVLFTNGDNDTFPLWYAQEVEHVRRDVTVIVTTYLRAPWYVKQIRALTTPCPSGVDAATDATRIVCQRRYEPNGGPAVYAGIDRPPGDSIVPLSDADIDRIAATAFVTDRPLGLRAGRIETVIPAGTQLMPEDTFVTAILAHAIGDRPVHFVVPSPPLRTLNLERFAIRQGLTFRLNDGPVTPDPERGLLALPSSPLSTVTGDYIDLARTAALQADVFVHRGGLPDRHGVWVDSATKNIPLYYGWMHAAVAQGLAATNDPAGARREAERAQAWLTLGQ